MEYLINSPDFDVSTALVQIQISPLSASFTS